MLTTTTVDSVSKRSSALKACTPVLFPQQTELINSFINAWTNNSDLSTSKWWTDDPKGWTWGTNWIWLQSKPVSQSTDSGLNMLELVDYKGLNVGCFPSYILCRAGYHLKNDDNDTNRVFHLMPIMWAEAISLCKMPPLSSQLDKLNTPRLTWPHRRLHGPITRHIKSKNSCSDWLWEKT